MLTEAASQQSSNQPVWQSLIINDSTSKQNETNNNQNLTTDLQECKVEKKMEILNVSDQSCTRSDNCMLGFYRIVPCRLFALDFSIQLAQC